MKTTKRRNHPRESIAISAFVQNVGTILASKIIMEAVTVVTLIKRKENDRNMLIVVLVLVVVAEHPYRPQHKLLKQLPI